jgi:hypothetical protein
MRMPTVAPVEIVVHGQHLLEHESTQPPGGGSSSAELGTGRLPGIGGRRRLESRSTPRFGTLAMGVPGRIGSGSDRFVAN